MAWRNSYNVSRLVIAGKLNICYDDSGKSLSRASNTCAYTKDEMDGFFFLYKAKIAPPKAAPKENRKVLCEIDREKTGRKTWQESSASDIRILDN